jgi:hypothetical protein
MPPSDQLAQADRPRGSGPWEEVLADVLWVRSPAMAEPLFLLLARTAVGAFRAVLDEWIAGPGAALPIELTDRAFDLVRDYEDW